MIKIIIDADVHISPYEKGNRIQIEELIRKLNNNNIEKAITWLQPPYLRHVAESNKYIFNSMKKYPNKIIGFGWVDPNLGHKKAIDEAIKCLDEYELYGIKLNGAQNDFIIDDKENVFPIIQEIAKRNKVLALHVGADAIENTHPYRVANIAKHFTDLKILAVHMGGVAVPDVGKAMIEFAEKNPNIFLVGSRISSTRLLEAVNTLGAERLCFGSDTPFTFARVELAKYKALFGKELSKEDLNKILGGNVKRLFKI